jgi:hypothetical protein
MRRIGSSNSLSSNRSALTINTVLARSGSMGH